MTDQAETLPDPWQAIKDALRCPSGGGHYCPNCDWSLYDLWEQILAARSADTHREQELARETELRREAEAHVRSLQQYLDQKPYPDEYDDMEQRALRAEAEIARLHALLRARDLPVGEQPGTAVEGVGNSATEEG